MRSTRPLVLLIALHAALVGYGGPSSFQVAPLIPAGDGFATGEWVDSDSLSSKDEITAIVMASWCPTARG
jgi:hypothetical protein